MAQSKTVMAFGEVLWDLLPDGAEKLGGAPFNFAYRVNSLGDTGLIVSRLGRDEYGARAAERIDQLDMDARCLQWDDSAPTGTVVVSFDAANEPDYVIVPDVAYDFVQATDTVLAAAAEADCICFGTLAQRTDGARAALQQILTVCSDKPRLLDINLRKDCYTTESIVASLDEATILKLNETEAAYLADVLDMSDHSIPAFCAEMIGRWSLTHCIVTLGETGAFADGAEADPVYVPGYAVETVDTLGAGDAFVAGFITRLLREASLPACLTLGNALGAMVAMQTGATDPIAPDTIDAFIASPTRRLIEPSLNSYAID